MTGELIQDAIVTAVALGAGGVVLRRVFGAVSLRGEGSRQSGCEKCPSAAIGPAGAPAAEKPVEPAVHPLIVVRTARRS